MALVVFVLEFQFFGIAAGVDQYLNFLLCLL